MKYIHTHTHTHLYLHLYLYYHSQNWLRGPQGVSQQEVTSLVVPLAAGTPALSPHLHDSWLQDSPPLRLVISRWLACENNQCQTLVSALTPRRKITQVFFIFTLPSGVWFTSMARLATKQKL